jgi:hypothetical protein
VPGGHQRAFRFPARVSITNASRARTVATAACRLPHFPPGVVNCPADVTLRYQLQFGTSDRRQLRAIADPFGCQSVTGAGPIRRADSTFWRALGRAVGVTNATDATFTGTP